MKEGSGCGPGKDSWSVSSGSFPPGLRLASEGVVSGTPTASGNFSFYVRVSYPVEPGCNGGWSDKRVTIPVKPEVPRLILQPEQTGVPISTVGAPFSLQMTSNLSDGKTWSIVSGALPPGLQIGSTDGLISGSPTTAGAYSFTVGAVVTNDPLATPARSDTKALVITVRDPVAIAPSEEQGPSEVGVDYESVLAASGGAGGTYTWALSAGALPRGVTFGPDGVISGTPRAAGTYRFTVTATDAEARIGTYAGRIVVAPRLAITRPQLKPAKVGRLWKLKLRSTGGVLPKAWKLKKGPLPKGVKFDKTLGLFSGTPAKAGRYRVTVELRDDLGVTATRTILIVVAPAA